MDSVCDSLVDGIRFRLLNVIDDYNRESQGNVPSVEFINPTPFNIKNLKILITNGPNIMGAYRAQS